MDVWIALVAAAVIGIGIALRRRRSPFSRTSEIDLGEVSQSWLTEQRADKRQDP